MLTSACRGGKSIRVGCRCHSQGGVLLGRRTRIRENAKKKDFLPRI